MGSYSYTAMNQNIWIQMTWDGVKDRAKRLSHSQNKNMNNLFRFSAFSSNFILWHKFDLVEVWYGVFGEATYNTRLGCKSWR